MAPAREEGGSSEEVVSVCVWWRGKGSEGVMCVRRQGDAQGLALGALDADGT